MTTAAYSAHPVLAPVAEAVLPALAVLAILLPALAWRKGALPDPRLFYICALGSVAMLYLVRYYTHHVAPQGLTLHGAHFIFSSHTALGISLCITLAAFRPILLTALVPLMAGYLWLIVFLHYHISYDVWATLGFMVPLSLICHRPWITRQIRKKQKPRPL